MGVMARTSDSNIGLVTFGSIGNKKDSRSYCANCEKVGISSPLKNRIYLDEQGNITSPQSDEKNWLMCWKCGTIVGIYEAKVQADIESLTEPTTNPFNNTTKNDSSSEQAEESIQLDHESRLTQHRRKKKKQDLSSQYKEQDIIDAVRKGAKVLSYSSTD